ncbi:MAG: branched-chain amino acid ABC transporter permease [Clostridia bacterium]
MKQHIKKSLIGLVIAIIGYILISLLINSKMLNDFYIRILMMIGINIVLATALNLVIGFTGQLVLGFAGFMSVGAYMSAVLTMKLQLPFIPALLVGGFVASVFGLLVGVPTLRLKGDYLAITTLGFGEIIRVLIVNIDYLGGPRGLPAIPKYTTYTWVYVICVLSVLVIYYIIHSVHGRAMISVREDEIAAESMGINTTIAKISAFVIAAFFAGIAGGLYGHFLMFIDPKSFDWLKSFEIVTFVVAGGMGSLSGSILSASALTLLPEILRLFGFSKYRMLLYAILLLILMLFRPQGLMGSKELSLKVFKNLGFKKAGGEK